MNRTVLLTRLKHPGIYFIIIFAAAVGLLVLNRLGSLTYGLSSQEVLVGNTPVGWHGIYHNPFYLPLLLVRSVIFYLTSHHDSTIIRLSNAMFGLLAVGVFSRLLQAWYGTRTAILGSILFASSAWVLHISRLASNDVIYLLTIPVLFLIHHGLRQANSKLWFYCSLFAWLFLLYVPGLIWLLGLQIYWKRRELKANWYKLHPIYERPIIVVSILSGLSLLIIQLSRSFANLNWWLGLPKHWPAPYDLIKQFLSVPVHLFIHGPRQPEIWLGRTPILDIASLALCLIGIYFYVTHRQAGRSKLLGSFALLGIFLVGIGGAVTLSMLIPIMYLFVACGIGYLLFDWSKVFPRNPLAKNFGVGLIILVVVASASYNLRAYFVAWPHNSDTRKVFTYR